MEEFIEFSQGSNEPVEPEREKTKRGSIKSLKRNLSFNKKNSVAIQLEPRLREAIEAAQKTPKRGTTSLTKVQRLRSPTMDDFSAVELGNQAFIHYSKHSHEVWGSNSTKENSSFRSNEHHHHVNYKRYRHPPVSRGYSTISHSSAYRNREAPYQLARKPSRDRKAKSMDSVRMDPRIFSPAPPVSILVKKTASGSTASQIHRPHLWNHSPSYYENEDSYYDIYTQGWREKPRKVTLML